MDWTMILAMVAFGLAIASLVNVMLMRGTCKKPYNHAAHMHYNIPPTHIDVTNHADKERRLIPMKPDVH